MAIKFLLLAATCVLLKEAAGHGMMLGPPNRSSLWRFDPTAPPNYEDNQNYCGGRGGKCGVCGDPYAAAHPQPNENTGKYGEGKVVANYKSGQVVETDILLTTNHKGKFEYALCVLPNPNSWEPESCFRDLTFEDGSSSFNIETGMREIKNRIRLPAGLTCNRCVLRWTYTTGNTWGQCQDGSWSNECGVQEHFISCSDISIS